MKPQKPGRSHHSVTRCIVWIVLTALAAACQSVPTRYVHPNADIAAIKKVAVLPFENVTADRAAGDKVQKVFLVELLSMEVFEVTEPGQVTKVLRSERLETDALGTDELKRIGKALGVDGLFLGSVVDFSETRTGSTSAPEVTVNLRLVETRSGVTVWTSGHTSAGATVSKRLFGIGGESLTEAARRLIRSELATLLE